MRVTPIPAFSDNYIWSLENGTRCWVVDPGDAQPVLGHLSDKNLSLEGILLTHHHFDHVGGVQGLLKHTSVPVYGWAGASISAIDHPLNEGESVDVFGCALTVLTTPGHTLDHISYFGELNEVGPSLFCGDTLFSSGCGRLFEGSPAMMLESLKKLSALPAKTKVFCAHEYTMANLAFAKYATPGLDAILQRHQQCKKLREQGEPTLPSTIEGERSYNPFLLADIPAVQAHVSSLAGKKLENTLEVFAAMRELKDNF